jgi:hypothetical protein
MVAAVAVAAYRPVQVRRVVAVAAAACQPAQVRQVAAVAAAAEPRHALAGREAQVALPVCLALPAAQAARAAPRQPGAAARPGRLPLPTARKRCRQRTSGITTIRYKRFS